jgi:hypothetical protein
VLAHRIPLVAVAPTIVVALPVVVIIVIGEATAFLFLLVRPALYHVE